MEVGVDSRWSHSLLCSLAKLAKPNVIKKIKKPGSGRGGLRWGEDVTRLVLEMLSHRTPPSCIGPNILSVAITIFPNDNIVQELPGISFVHECRSVHECPNQILDHCPMCSDTDIIYKAAKVTTRDPGGTSNVEKPL